MFLEHLALSYKCNSSIGNSLDLKKMLDEVVNTFVTQTDAISGAFFLKDDANNYYKYLQFDDKFDEKIEDYIESSKTFGFIDSKKNSSNGILVIPTKNGTIYLIYKKENFDLDFYGSMFQDLIVKLNISIDACLNMQRLKSKNNQLDKLALRLEEQKKELENSNSHQTNFLANISHELKTPLNSIIILSNLMAKNKDGSLNNKNIKNAKIINSCGNDLLNLINDILDVSKIESGELALDLRKIEVKELIENIYLEMLPLAKDKHLKLSRILNINDDLILFSDVGRIKQIIKNLLSNAIKFTHEGEIIIDVSMNDEFISIKIIDEGIGIEKSKISTVFERFKQADGSTTRKYGGSGLGLSVSKELTELLNGSLTAQSELGQGSTFELQLPRKTNITNISDEKVSLGNSEDEIEDIVLFDDYEVEEEKEDIKPKVLFINNDHLLFFTYTIELKKHGLDIDKSDHLELLSQNDNKYDLIIINDNYKKDEVLSFMKSSGYDKNKFLIVSNEIYDIKHTITHDEIKTNFVKKVLKILGIERI